MDEDIPDEEMARLEVLKSRTPVSSEREAPIMEILNGIGKYVELQEEMPTELQDPGFKFMRTYLSELKKTLGEEPIDLVPVMTCVYWLGRLVGPSEVMHEYQSALNRLRRARRPNKYDDRDKETARAIRDQKVREGHPPRGLPAEVRRVLKERWGEAPAHDTVKKWLE